MLLLEGGADPAVVDGEGNSLLHLTKSPELVAALPAKADLNATNQV